MNQQFRDTFEKYRDINDKFESLYIFVIRDMSIENVINEITRMITIIEEIGNYVKKKYLKNRLSSLITYLECQGLENTISKIYMVYDKIDEIEINNEWNETLEMFKCKKFVCEYGSNFNLEWLHDYLTDRSYLNVLHVQSNNIKCIHLNRTKRVVFFEVEEKKADLNQHIPKNEYCVIHGISSFIRQIVETPLIKVLNGNKKDEEILEEFEKMLNEKKANELQQWLDFMANTESKESKKIIFGKEITDAINDHMLKTLYCTPRMKKQVLEKIQEDDLIFNIIEIRSYTPTDIGMRLRRDFNGAIGIKFY